MACRDGRGGHARLHPRRHAEITFTDGLAGQDMGKGCIRFRKPEAIDYGLVRDLLTAVAATPGKIC